MGEQVSIIQDARYGRLTIPNFLNPVYKAAVILNPSGPLDLMVFHVTNPCAVTSISGYRSGGSGATINARRNTVDDLLAVDLSLSQAGVWIQSENVINDIYEAGDTLELRLVSIAGSPTQITIQVKFRMGHE